MHTTTADLYTLSLHDALPIFCQTRKLDPEISEESVRHPLLTRNTVHFRFAELQERMGVDGVIEKSAVDLRAGAKHMKLGRSGTNPIEQAVDQYRAACLEGRCDLRNQNVAILESGESVD